MRTLSLPALVSLALASVLIAPGAAAAGSLSVGPLEDATACQRFCDELVYDCQFAVFSPDSGMCLVWDRRGWQAADGLTVGTRTETDCAAVADATGWAFWWDADTGWCRQGVRDFECQPADWAGLWRTTYEDMRLEVGEAGIAGTYRLNSGRDYRLNGDTLPGDACVLVGEWDHNDGDTGPFRFQLTAPDRFDGTWSSGLPPAAGSPVNWTGTRY